MRVLLGCLLAALCGVAAAGQAPATFPAQQRAPGDPAVIARGNTLYTSFCRSCHGVDLRGGDLGGPNLLRSQILLNDNDGESVGPVIRAGRVPPGGGTAMPPLGLPDADIKAVAEYLRSVVFTSQPQGAPPAGAQVALNLLVGNARAGQKFFTAECTACHSPSADLAGIATRISSIEQLQNAWVGGRRPAGQPGDAMRRAVRVTVALDSGQRISGQLVRNDDFVVSLTTDAGEYRSFTRRGTAPRVASVEVQDPLAPHRVLWTKLNNKTMHDVTAYLATLK